MHLLTRCSKPVLAYIHSSVAICFQGWIHLLNCVQSQFCWLITRSFWASLLLHVQKGHRCNNNTDINVTSLLGLEKRRTKGETGDTLVALSCATETERWNYRFCSTCHTERRKEVTSTKSLHRLPVARDLCKQLWQRDTEASHARYYKAGMCKRYSLTDLLALGGTSTMNHVQPRSPSGHRNTVFS